jgi:glycolate dehydrogenase FAD-linked subunit
VGTLLTDAMRRDLGAIVGADGVADGSDPTYLRDATETRGITGQADAVACPQTTDEVARVLRWCYDHDVPLTPRGGGTGFAGGAVPVEGGIVLALERMAAIRTFEPLLWRAEVEAGVRTAHLQQRARENGLSFPPDPGAPEQSQIGGNIATNAGGPHAFKYGVTGRWVTGLEAVVPPGDVITVGGPIRKDVAGYDLKSLLIGSEGTLGIVTAAWLTLIPAPEAAFPVVGFYESTQTGCAALERVVGSGLVPAALEYLDAGALRAAGPSFPEDAPAGAGFMVIAEADGSRGEAEQLRGELQAVLEEDALAVRSPTDARETAELWRWREGVAFAVIALRGGKSGEDIVVPFDRLAEAIEETVAIGSRHGLDACSWGHAGDGNVHANFVVDPRDQAELDRARAGAEELYAMAIRLGGSISGEHGIGWTKRGWLARQWAPRAVELHAEVKRLFDPKGLLNPGKKR